MRYQTAKFPGARKSALGKKKHFTVAVMWNSSSNMLTLSVEMTFRKEKKKKKEYFLIKLIVKAPCIVFCPMFTK